MASCRKTTLVLVFLLSPFFEPLIVNSRDADRHVNKGCIEGERKSLVEFKHGVIDTSGWLSSWVDGSDCCSNWRGVYCNNQTGNIVKLDLRNNDDEYFSPLGGQISDSLLGLKHLNYLDLSFNDFGGLPIPDFFGSFERLRYLNLSNAAFGGMIPPHLGNLSHLRYLDLRGEGIGVYGTMRVSNLNWLSGLSLLKYLDLGGVDLSKLSNNITNWTHPINMLPSLLELHLSSCQLSEINFPPGRYHHDSMNPHHNPFPVVIFNLTSLLVLDLSNNYFQTTTTLSGWLQGLGNLVSLDLSGNIGIGSEGLIDELLVNGLSICCNNSLEELRLGSNGLSGQLPDSLGNFSNLRDLDLSSNSLVGPLPDSMQQLTKLESLDLSMNAISGPIPTWIGNLLRMTRLDFSFNLMNGTIPESIGQLEELTELSLDGNSWEGVISEIHLSNLTKLEAFSLHLPSSPKKKNDQPFRFLVKPEWIPPFSSLISVDISNCELSHPAFPSWLTTQKRLDYIVLKNVGISDTIPEWLWTLDFSWLDLSENQLHGKLPEYSLSFSPAALFVDLSSNRLGGRLPLWHNVTWLFLGNNSFSGPIPLNIGDSSTLQVLDLSSNLLNGSIPSSMSKLQGLKLVDLSNNHLSGKIPMNWNDLQGLQTIDLSKNKLSGGIPSWMSSMFYLSLLKLNDNNLSGKLSPSLQNCIRLKSLDLGNNKFSGEIPNWIGERMSSLRMLRLQTNMLTGYIPEQLCWLSNLHILDLALNNLSGSIPQCLGNLTALKKTYKKTFFGTVSGASSVQPYKPISYSDHMELVMKGQVMEFESILSIVKLIDLSSNNLWGEIPKGITNLSTLGTLNFSRNHLTGEIPENIGAMQGIETLDLSCNRLSGPIPPTMSSITSLSHLNLSHNILSGPIPTANQFSTFNDPSIYEGNLGLCGLPLSTNCSSTPSDQIHKNDQDDEEDEVSDQYMTWFFLSMGMGFPVGFWIVCGTLALSKSWRHAYFRVIHEIGDRLYVFSVVNMARLRNKIERIGIHG